MLPFSSSSLPPYFILLNSECSFWHHKAHLSPRSPAMCLNQSTQTQLARCLSLLLQHFQNSALQRHAKARRQLNPTDRGDRAVASKDQARRLHQRASSPDRDEVRLCTRSAGYKCIAEALRATGSDLFLRRVRIPMATPAGAESCSTLRTFQVAV